MIKDIKKLIETLDWEKIENPNQEQKQYNRGLNFAKSQLELILKEQNNK